jgi:hypothetical protein
MADWRKEYLLSMNNQIYSRIISPTFYGDSFADVFLWVWRKLYSKQTKIKLVEDWLHPELPCAACFMLKRNTVKRSALPQRSTLSSQMLWCTVQVRERYRATRFRRWKSYFSKSTRFRNWNRNLEISMPSFASKTYFFYALYREFCFLLRFRRKPSKW